MSARDLPRVLAHAGRGRALTLAEHDARAGSLDQVAHRREQLIDTVAAAGLRGRGGAAFPTATKLRAVAGRRGRRALVVNGAESEPLSAKDRALLELAPHLVIDGALLAAEAVRAREVVIAVKSSAREAQAAAGSALAERRDAAAVRVETVSTAYLAGEESALLRGLNGGPAKPTVVPPRPFERGLGGRPTLVANVETLAQLALIARHGADWFRELGTADHAGSALVTIGGAVERPAVYEVALGTPIPEAIAAAGDRGAAPRAVLVGGYYGAWLGAGTAASTTLDNGSLRAHGAALGAGVVVALPRDACPAAEVARVVRWMAGQNSRQCGPCVHGLDAIAGVVDSIAAGSAGTEALARLDRWSRQVEGRGACHHPDGVVRFLRSALAVFAEELDDHRRHGPCSACHRPPVLAVPDPRLREAA
jgi:NADH:ubiquinone oxidoreductase subunit F (NADH-binding)